MVHSQTDERVAAILTKLLCAVAEEFLIDAHSLSNETTPAEIAGWDSISHVMVILKLENVFSVQLNVAELHICKTLGEIAADIELRIR